MDNKTSSKGEVICGGLVTIKQRLVVLEMKLEIMPEQV